jgi:rubredoxin
MKLPQDNVLLQELSAPAGEVLPTRPILKKSATIPIIFHFTKGEVMWRCTVCGYEYDEAKEGTPFEKLPDDWTCPVCNAPKSEFEKVR